MTTLQKPSKKVVKLDGVSTSTTEEASDYNQSERVSMKSYYPNVPASKQLEVPVHTAGVRASLARMRQSRREAQAATGEKV